MKTCIRWAVLLGVVAMLSLALPATAQDDTYFPGAEWRTSTPEEQGMDSAKLLEALQYIEDEALPIDSLTVIRNGYVVLDAYYYPYTADMKHNLWHITGSVVSALTGIAIEDGAIESLDVPMISLFPDAVGMEVNERGASSTLGDFLNYHSDILCTDDNRIFAEALEAEDAIQYRLETLFAPRRTNYKGFFACNSNYDLVAGALQLATGQALAEYAEATLFGPIGIQDYAWTTDQNGIPLGAFGLALTPHDLARFGYLYLRGGEWNGEQIVPSEWVDLTTCADLATCPHKWEPPWPEWALEGYGYR